MDIKGNVELTISIIVLIGYAVAIIRTWVVISMKIIQLEKDVKQMKLDHEHDMECARTDFLAAIADMKDDNRGEHKEIKESISTNFKMIFELMKKM